MALAAAHQGGSISQTTHLKESHQINGKPQIKTATAYPEPYPDEPGSTSSTVLQRAAGWLKQNHLLGRDLLYLSNRALVPDAEV